MAERETVEEVIRRFGICRCGEVFRKGSIGWQHNDLPVIIPLCRRCARSLGKPPADFTIVSV